MTITFITGANKGLGHETARRLIEAGHTVYVGSRNEERGITYGHHHPRFDMDEEALGACMKTMTTSVLRYLQEGLDD